MHDSRDDQLAEYQDIKAWLAGQKPPAAGRTWRRRLQVQIQQVLPRPVRGVAYALAPRAGPFLVRLAIVVALSNVFLSVMGPGIMTSLESARGLGPILLREEVLHTLTVMMWFTTNIGGAVAALGVAVSWVIAGK